MKAAVTGKDGTIIVQEVPTPQPGVGEVVIKIHYCGICGSELKPYIEGTLPVDSIIGHELSGEVAAVGPGVEGWKKGNRVVAAAYSPCGACVWCRRGRPNMCLNKWWIGLGFHPGALAEFCLVKANML